MKKQVSLVVFHKTLSQELRVLFEEDLREFEHGCPYFVASGVELLGSFFRVELISEKSSDPRIVWISTHDVLTVMSGVYESAIRMGFQP